MCFFSSNAKSFMLTWPTLARSKVLILSLIIGEDMSRVCQVTGKKAMSGHHVSHANNKRKRRFLPNLHVKKFWSASLNKFIKLRVSIHGLRTIDKLGIEKVLETIQARETK